MYGRVNKSVQLVYKSYIFLGFYFEYFHRKTWFWSPKQIGTRMRTPLLHIKQPLVGILRWFCKYHRLIHGRITRNL